MRASKNTKSPELWVPGLRMLLLFEKLLGKAERLQNLNVFGLKALGAFGHVELNGLAFLKAAESAGSDRGEMYEDIFAVLPADKAESLRIVKPLYSSLFHCVVPVFLNFLLRRSVAAWSG